MLIFAITAVPLAITAELTDRSGIRLTAGVIGTAILGLFALSIGLQGVTNVDGLDSLPWVTLFACVLGPAAIVGLQPWVLLGLVRRGRTRVPLAEPAS